MDPTGVTPIMMSSMCVCVCVWKCKQVHSLSCRHHTVWETLVNFRWHFKFITQESKLEGKTLWGSARKQLEVRWELHFNTRQELFSKACLQLFSLLLWIQSWAHSFVCSLLKVFYTNFSTSIWVENGPKIPFYAKISSIILKEYFVVGNITALLSTV